MNSYRFEALLGPQLKGHASCVRLIVSPRFGGESVIKAGGNLTTIIEAGEPLPP